MVVQSKKEAVIKSKNNTQTLKILINKKIVSPSDISTSVKKPAALNLEENIGLKLFSWIGILALVIGVGYFIKYAIENNLIGYLTRIILGVVFGIILIIIGELFAKKEKYELWARTLAGGGFAITYFSVYAAYHFEEYRRAIGISQTLDIILLTIVVIIFSGPLGFLTFTISTFTGIYCIQTGVKRTNMMACLLLPTIVLYLF